MGVDYRPWLRRNWRWLGLLVLLWSLIAIPEAGARAGGGGGFSSGGGGSSSSSSSSSSSGGSFSSGGGSGGGNSGPVGFAIVGLFMLTIIIIVVKGDKQQGKSIQKNKKLADGLAIDNGLQRIQGADPAFSPDGFLRRISPAFRRLQHAWSDQDFTPVRSFISDAVHERFSLQIAEMKQRGVRNVMEDIAVLTNEIAQVDVNDQFQTITIRIQASAVDYEADADGHLTSGSRTPESFVEYWSFVRRPGTTTRDADGLLEGNCPNCNTPLQLNQVGMCESCDAKVCSGRYDWILAEITQESEWQSRAHSAVPGATAMAEADPSFCLQHLEDRASVMFWRRTAAAQSGETAPLRKMATAEYCQAMEEELKPDSDGLRSIPTQMAVGSVETEGILCDSPLDKALVRIRWSGGTEHLLPDGTRRPAAAVSVRPSYYLLTRKHGVKGDADDALSSAHCQGCGGPITSSVANACDYCGAVLTDGDQDWVLAGIYTAAEQPVRDFRASLQNLEQPEGTATTPPATPAAQLTSRAPATGKELMAWVVHVMLADGKIDEQEKELLGTLAGLHGVSQRELQNLVFAVRAGELHIGLPKDAEAAGEWLGSMAKMALADGFIAPEEEKAMLILAGRLGLTKKDVNQTIVKTRQQLKHEQKQRVKELRTES